MLTTAMGGNLSLERPPSGGQAGAIQAEVIGGVSARPQRISRASVAIKLRNRLND
jgi:hypothetical protein